MIHTVNTIQYNRYISPLKREEAGRQQLNQQQETLQEEQAVQKLRIREQEVKAHEVAHMVAGGVHTGQMKLSYESGPDGKQYATGGEVSINVTEERSPEDTIEKMELVKKAALAPQNPSTQDRRVAAMADQKKQKAMMALKLYQQEEQVEQGQLISIKV